MQYKTDDLRIKEIKELAPPAHLLRELALTDAAAKTVFETRTAIHRILHGADDRLLVIMGPCSIHDTKAAREYAARLKEAVVSFPGTRNAELRGDRVLADIDQSEMAALNEYLMKQGILLYHIAAEHQTLESVFMSLTGGADGFGAIA